MQEKTLLKIALICSILGLVVLVVVSESTTLDETALNKITLDNKDEYVKVKGVITNIIDTDTVTIVTIQQPQETKVVIFKQNTGQTNLKENGQVEILGKVDEYNGELEIIAHRARIIN